MQTVEVAMKPRDKQTDGQAEYSANATETIFISVQSYRAKHVHLLFEGGLEEKSTVRLNSAQLELELSLAIT